jgi:hypothetical protein
MLYLLSYLQTVLRRPCVQGVLLRHAGLVHLLLQLHLHVVRRTARQHPEESTSHQQRERRGYRRYAVIDNRIFCHGIRSYLRISDKYGSLTRNNCPYEKCQYFEITGGKPANRPVVLLQYISGVSAINPLVAFYDIHGGKREVLFLYFVPDTAREWRPNLKQIPYEKCHTLE